MNEQTINDDVTMRESAPRVSGRLRAGDEILGRYVVEGELGQGGMGVVYRCLDKVGGVAVAVKGLPPEVSHSADEMEEVRANFGLVSDLRHPNICGVRTLEQDAAGDYYLVMDLGAGENLNRWMRRNPDAPFETKLAILRQIASALDYAHARKIIHRDVKPENVLVEEAGHVFVLDFGLAAQIRSSLSRTSQAITSKSGTPTYKSPEQWLGQPQSAAADQYALGVIAYRLFASRLPFDGDDPVILGQAVLSAPVPAIPGVPRPVNAALARALAKKPESRFPTCTDFITSLTSSSSRHGRLVVVGLLSSLLLAAGAVVGWLGGRRTSEPMKQREKDVEPRVTPVAVPTPIRQELNPTTVQRAPKLGDRKTITLPGGAKLTLVWCPAGTFTMGSPTSENGHFDDETLHRVTLARGFWMASTEITQAQWESVMGANLSHFKGVDRPVENVSWDDCQEFLRKAGQGIRLPTEAEWEYACRAGSSEPFAGDLDKIAWYGDNSGSETHDVGTKEPNAWGLYDMHGNVWEWCQDGYGSYPVNAVTDPSGAASGGSRVGRGGSWCDGSHGCRSALRGWNGPGCRNDLLGFRVACSEGLHD